MRPRPRGAHILVPPLCRCDLSIRSHSSPFKCGRHTFCREVYTFFKFLQKFKISAESVHLSAEMKFKISAEICRTSAQRAEAYDTRRQTHERVLKYRIALKSLKALLEAYPHTMKLIASTSLGQASAMSTQRLTPSLKRDRCLPRASFLVFSPTLTYLSVYF
jgi:hypothetical protein